MVSYSLQFFSHQSGDAEGQYGYEGSMTVLATDFATLKEQLPAHAQALDVPFGPLIVTVEWAPLGHENVERFRQAFTFVREE